MNIITGIGLLLSGMSMICLGIPLNAADTSATKKAEPKADQTEVTPDMTTSAATANHWLTLLDKESYDQSWKDAAKIFQQTMPEKEWKSYLEGVRKPLGSVSTRQMIDQRPAKDPNGLPAGDYMVIFYNTSFAKKPSAYELVTMMKESDGQWRILTYQVQ